MKNKEALPINVTLMSDWMLVQVDDNYHVQGLVSSPNADYVDNCMSKKIVKVIQNNVSVCFTDVDGKDYFGLKTNEGNNTILSEVYQKSLLQYVESGASGIFRKVKFDEISNMFS